MIPDWALRRLVFDAVMISLMIYPIKKVMDWMIK